MRWERSRQWRVKFFFFFFCNWDGNKIKWILNKTWSKSKMKKKGKSLKLGLYPQSLYFHHLRYGASDSFKIMNVTNSKKEGSTSCGDVTLDRKSRRKRGHTPAGPSPGRAGRPRRQQRRGRWRREAGLGSVQWCREDTEPTPQQTQGSVLLPSGHLQNHTHLSVTYGTKR